MYLGELTRNVLIALIDATPKSLLFSGKSTPVLNKHYGLDTSFMSATEEAWIGDNSADTATYNHPPLGADFKREDLNPKVVAKLDLIRRVIAEHLGFQEDEVSLRDAAITRWVCSLVARRAALLSGVAVATVLIQTERASLKAVHPPKRDANGRLGVGVDGSLVEHYPNFRTILRESLRTLVGEDVETRVEIGLAKDGSGVGAALCALMALKSA
jgi:hexokinase